MKHPDAAAILVSPDASPRVHFMDVKQVRRHGVYVWGLDWEKAKAQAEVGFSLTFAMWQLHADEDFALVLGLSLRDRSKDEDRWSSHSPESLRLQHCTILTILYHYPFLVFLGHHAE